MRFRVELLGHILRIEPAPDRKHPPGLGEEARPWGWQPERHPALFRESDYGSSRHESEGRRWLSPERILPITGGGVLAVTLVQVIGADASKLVEILSAVFGMATAALILHLAHKKVRR